MDELGRRACFLAVNIYDSMITTISERIMETQERGAKRDLQGG